MARMRLCVMVTRYWRACGAHELEAAAGVPDVPEVRCRCCCRCRLLNIITLINIVYIVRTTVYSIAESSCKA